MSGYPGTMVTSGSGSCHGLVSAPTHRSLAESSASGVSQVLLRVLKDLVLSSCVQVTLQSYDASGHYPDLLDIPNRDCHPTSPTSVTVANNTASTTFTHNVSTIAEMKG